MNDLAGAHLGHEVIDLPQRPAMRDEAAPVGAGGGELSEDARDILMRTTLATLGSGERAAEVERKRVDADFFVVRQDAEQDTASAAHPSQVVGGFDDARAAGAIDGDIGGATQNFFDPRCGILVA